MVDMGAYDDLTNDQLKALLATRDLPVSGTKPELLARLEQNDLEKANAGNDDLLDGDADQPPAPGEPTPPAAPDEPAGPTEQPKSVLFKYPCYGELSTGAHEDNRRRAYSDAVAAGHAPKGGLAAVHRARFEEVPGKGRHAVYEVTLRKQQ